MKKSVINLEEAEKIYKECGSLHKTAKILKTSHIRLSELFKENKIQINNIGKERVMDDAEIDSAISDYVTNHLKMEEISKKYNVRIHKLRSIFVSKGIKISKWNGHIKKEKPIHNIKIKKVVETKKCPYCGWETKDITGKAHSYQIHLVHKHNIDIDEHLKQYPEDYELIKDEKNRREKKVQCKICGKWLYTIDNRHLLKHNINKLEYIEKFYGSKIMSDSTKEKLQCNLKKMMDNDQWERKTSSYEKDIETFLNENNVSYEMHNREVLNGLELDFLAKNIAIEFNGNKFHTEHFGRKDRYYHLNKLEICNKKGISLIQIFEDEYKEHRNIVLSKIKHIFGIDDPTKKIPARKCTIQEVMREDAEQFLNENHIQGFVNSTVYLGAIFEGKIVGVMCFLNDGGGNWNLTRFASLNDYICQGLASKMLTHFIRKYDPDYIRSFADRRWTLDKDNNVYTKIGFKLDEILKPEYRYYNEKVDKYKRFHKFGFRKSVLHRKYGLPMNMTETEMAIALGYDRIWDCGLFKYVWRKGEQ